MQEIMSLGRSGAPPTSLVTFRQRPSSREVSGIFGSLRNIRNHVFQHKFGKFARSIKFPNIRKCAIPSREVRGAPDLPNNDGAP